MTPAAPLEPDPTTVTNVGASLHAEGLRRVVVRSAAGRECDHGQGSYQDGEHAHRQRVEPARSFGKDLIS